MLCALQRLQPVQPPSCRAAREGSGGAATFFAKSSSRSSPTYRNSVYPFYGQPEICRTDGQSDVLTIDIIVQKMH